MTFYQPRRLPRLKTAALALAGLAAAGAAAYAGWMTRLPDRVCVSVQHAPAPARRAGASRPGAGEPALSVPDVSLSGVSWAGYRGYQLPVSPQAGPRDTAGGLASGYADTPLGALLAAVNITARTSWEFGPGVFGPTVSRQVTGRFAAQMLSADQASWSQDAAGPAAGTTGSRQVAFAFEAYTPADATVDIVSGAPGTGGYVVTRIQAERTGGDWRVLAPPGGDWSGSATQVQSPAGFTAFPGQGG
jgi:hypothetical protein